MYFLGSFGMYVFMKSSEGIHMYFSSMSCRSCVRSVSTFGFWLAENGLSGLAFVGVALESSGISEAGIVENLHFCVTVSIVLYVSKTCMPLVGLWWTKNVDSC